MKNIRDFLGKEILFFDGGTGSVLQSQGLKPGELPETWNILHPEKIIDLHYSYYEAGCNIVKTNTFGANVFKFHEQLTEIVEAALKNAHTAREKIEKTNNSDKPHFIALDIGPIGKLLEPLGDISFDEAVQVFSKTISAGLCCKNQPDLILIETMNDCYEAKAAVIASKEVMAEKGIDLPIFVTTVYDETGKSLTGSDACAMATIFEGLGVDALGMNCSLGPFQMAKILPELAKETNLPIIMNPNAGLPRTKDGVTFYDVTPQEFAQVVSSFIEEGAGILGGCCGTTPEHIRYLVEACAQKKYQARPEKIQTRICSGTKTVKFEEKPILVGERINPTGKKRFKQALRENDIPYIL